MDIPPTAEPPPSSRIELKHFPTVTIAINPAFRSDERTRGLVEDLKEGIPLSWNYHSKDSWTDPDKLFFAKKRWVDATSVRTALEDAVNGDSFGVFDKKEIQAFNSLLNEIKLSSKVKSIVSSEQVKELVQKHGFEDISFVEPLLGIINKSTGDKVMAYDFVDAANFYEIPTEQIPTSIFDKLSDGLSEIFGNNNIEATDLDRRQILVDRKDPKKLYLIDIEGYIPQPSQHSEYPQE